MFDIHCFIIGAYTPVTMDGSIIVNGLAVSCYAYFDHELANIGMTPMQWYPEIVDWIFGRDKESPGYINLVSNVAKWSFLHDLNFF